MIKANKSANEQLKQKIELLVPPIKGERDTKEYRTIRLENGLTVCLVSDVRPNEEIHNVECLSEDSEDSGQEDETEDDGEESVEGESDNDKDDTSKIKVAKSKEGKEKMAACALCVSVGSFNDPLEIPGLAHFLEHMVFMGSEKFTSENHFDSFISRHGGENNASTDLDYTTFYFDCLERYLLPAMDKFAQFFIAPLMKRDSMQREREAVESEFQAALPSDSNRREQLLSNLICDEDGELSRFSWGNMITLKDGIDDDELYSRLHKFRERHYSAHRMTLAVQSRLPLDTLEQYVISSFSAIPKNNLPPPTLPLGPVQANPAHLWNRIYHVCPVRAVHRIDLNFSLPPLQQNYRRKPLEYIGWLLGGEGKGSVLSLLKAQNWALSIESGNSGQGSEDNQLYTLLPVSVVLTEEGVDHWQEVVEAILSYIQLMKNEGPQEWLYKEMALIADVRFRFAEQDDPTDNVEHLVESMQLYQPEDYLTGSELHMDYYPETIEMVMNWLQVDVMNIMISTNKQIDGVVYDLTEKWFNTKYCVKDIPTEWLSRWKSVEVNPDLSLPLPNTFLTTDFELVNKEQNRVGRSITSTLMPKVLIESPSIELWFKPDTQFRTPHVSYTFYFINPICTDSAENNCMLEILREMLHQELNEKAYPAILADLLYEFKLGDMGLQLTLFGYNQKLPELLELVSQHLRALPNNMNPALFKSLKDLQRYNYFNRSIKPSQMTKDIRLSILMPTFYTSLEKYEIVENITLEKLREFSLSYLDNLYIQGLVCGNITEKDAIKLGQNLVQILRFNPIPKQHVLKKDVKQLPIGERCCRVKSLNPDDTNTHITRYFQNGPGNLKHSVYIQLLMCIIEEPLFDTLRTKEQLGYNVYPLLRDTQTILGMSITVQTRTNKATPSHVDSRIAAFLAHVTTKLLKNMPEKRFNLIKQDLIKVKQCEDSHLREEVSRIWDEIEIAQYIFDRREKEIESIKAVKLGDLRKFWANLIGVQENGNGSKQLTVQVVGQKINKDSKSAKDIQNATEINENSFTKCRKLDLEFLGKEDLEKDRGTEYFISNSEALKEFKSGLVSFVMEIERDIKEVKEIMVE